MEDGASALIKLAERRYAAMVLDWMLPGLDGLAVLERMRRDGDETPVLLLTARDAVDDRVRGLDAGADDYLVKPFALAELLARLRVLVRRMRGARGRIIEIEDLRIDTAGKVVHRGSSEIPLSSREYAILECLALNRGRIVNREQLIAHAYQGDSEPESNVVEVYLVHLRRKIDRASDVKLIHTRRGLGYLLGAG